MKSMWKKKEDGDISRKEYDDWWAQKKGYENYIEYKKEWRHETGRNQDMSENKDCAQYLGIHISEKYLSKIWDNVIRMPNGNRGYDFICGKGFKVDVKSACLSMVSTNYRDYYGWRYLINKNKVADYFLLLAYDNRKDLNPLHIWLIKGDEIINKKNLNNRDILMIFNSSTSLYKYKVYERIDKLDNLKECCENLKT